MKLVEVESPSLPSVHLHRAHSFSNGNRNHVVDEDTDSESDVEELEPVSASLVLRVVSEAPSPNLPRKSTLKRDGAPAFLTEDSSCGTFLQVQVQRSSSSSSLGGRKSARSQVRDQDWAPIRPSSSCTSYGLGSRESTMSPTATTSLYDLSETELTRPNGLNSVDFMARVSSQTKLIQQSLQTLRTEVDDPMKLLDIGQEAIILSGLSKHASDSLKNIKNLYDETKYLKTYLEKLEAKVHYDIAMRRKTSSRPPWWRRLIFLGFLLSVGGFVWQRQSPATFAHSVSLMSQKFRVAATSCLEFFTSREPRETVPQVVIQ